MEEGVEKRRGVTLVLHTVHCDGMVAASSCMEPYGSEAATFDQLLLETVEEWLAGLRKRHPLSGAAPLRPSRSLESAWRRQKESWGDRCARKEALGEVLWRVGEREVERFMRERPPLVVVKRGEGRVMITGAGILQDPVCHSTACGEDAGTVRCAKRRRRWTCRGCVRDSLRFDCSHVEKRVCERFG